MRNYIVHPWKVIENTFRPDYQEAAESIFSLGNGRMGSRANFEEHYSGKSLQGTYIAGIYYPDKTRVGWWKNGYPEYFAKVLNSPNFLGIDVHIDSETLDLATWTIGDFYRELDMKNGLLVRSFTATSPTGTSVTIQTERFYSMVQTSVAAIRYSITANNRDCSMVIVPKIDGNVVNQDANYDEKFWNVIDTVANSEACYLSAQTKKLGFVVTMAMQNKLYLGNNGNNVEPKFTHDDLFVSATYTTDVPKGQTLTLEKYISVKSSLDYRITDLAALCTDEAIKVKDKGYDELKEEHSQWWLKKWETCSIEIEGDNEAQQGIHFNIFHLYQTYTGVDPRLNIGPKGFTGEKYGGSTYWDTEAFCVPFYMSTAGHEVARNLLKYRYNQLDKAIENGQKLGFSNGAALYPMVTMNGEECHNEWEITFEEIHRNGAIAYAIFYYTLYTNDTAYIEQYGIEVLVGIARFWAQRATFSEHKQKYMILGVTGPNEYENNVNNNWYTNYIAAWCLRYTYENLESIAQNNPQRISDLVKKAHFDYKTETGLWKKIVENMYFPTDKERGIFLQQDGYLDKELLTVDQIPSGQRPINQHWSWDRILRSCFIKQADVMQGLWFFEHEFDKDVVERNYKFYEPRTVHESSLSPCIYSIQAAYIGRVDEAYNLYLRTSRLDLDDYNKEVKEGLHITSMAGTWMSIVMGFGGMRVKNDKLFFSPKLPKGWKRLSFHIHFRGRLLKIDISNESVDVTLLKGQKMEVVVDGNLLPVV